MAAGDKAVTIEVVKKKMVRFSICFENRTVSPDRLDVGVGERGIQDSWGIWASAVGGWSRYQLGKTAGEACLREKGRSSA